MTEVGAFDAKTHLPKLLDRVQRGERITITKHGKPVAELVPIKSQQQEQTRSAIEFLKAFRMTHPVNVDEITSMITEGRKH